MRSFVSLLITFCFHLCVRRSETIKVCDLSISQEGRPAMTVNDTVEKGTDVTVTCNYNFTGSIRWIIPDQLEIKESENTVKIIYIQHNTTVTCNVSSDNESVSCDVTITVKDVSNMVLILICVGGAAGVLILFAVVMKVVLRRGQVRRNNRKRQRQQNLENIHSTVNTVNTVSSYY